MTSVFRDALGEEFDRLDPMMQRRFAFSSADGVCQIGTGTMDEVWHGPWWTLPFLMLGSTRRILFPDRGHDVPFTVANYSYVDSLGRETLTWARRFHIGRRVRCFDATMIYSPRRKAIVDFLGTHQHLAVDIACAVDDDGAICISTGAQRFHEGRVGFRFPLALSGVADVREWWDPTIERYRIEVVVANRFFGPLFGYRGSFTVVEHACAPEDVPLDVRPIREEARE